MGIADNDNKVNGDSNSDSKINGVKFVKRKISSKIAKFKILVKSKNQDFFFKFKDINTSGSDLLIDKAKLAFTKLK